MSIEKTISDLTTAINALTTALNQRVGGAGAPIVQQAAAPYANVGAQSMQNLVAAVAPQAPTAAQAQMPTLPTFAAAPAQQQAVLSQPNAPFTDGAGLIAYVMGAYKEMGPTKGALIQGVLTQLGYNNINDVKPEHYGSLFQGVEALKRG